MFERVRHDATTLQTIAAEGRLALAYDTGAQTEQIWALAVAEEGEIHKIANELKIDRADLVALRVAHQRYLPGMPHD